MGHSTCNGKDLFLDRSKGFCFDYFGGQTLGKPVFFCIFGGRGEELAVISCLTPGGPAQRCRITVRL